MARKHAVNVWFRPRPKPVDLQASRSSLADSEGFEPPIPSRVLLISSQVPSATRPAVHNHLGASRLGDGAPGGRSPEGERTSELLAKRRRPTMAGGAVNTHSSPSGGEASKLLRRQAKKHRNFFAVRRRSIKTSSPSGGEASKLLRRQGRSIEASSPSGGEASKRLRRQAEKHFETSSPSGGEASKLLRNVFAVRRRSIKTPSKGLRRQAEKHQNSFRRLLGGPALAAPASQPRPRRQ